MEIWLVSSSGRCTLRIVTPVPRHWRGWAADCCGHCADCNRSVQHVAIYQILRRHLPEENAVQNECKVRCSQCMVGRSCLFVASDCCAHDRCFHSSQPLDFRNDHRLLHPLWRALSMKPVMSPQNHDVDLDEPDPWWPEVLSPSCAARCVLESVTAWSRFHMQSN